MNRTINHIICLLLLTTAAFAQQEKKSAQADPAAWNLLKSANENARTFPANFAGATGEIVFNDHGQIATGQFSYAVGKGAELQFSGLGDEAKQWLNEQVASLIAHRRFREFAKGDGRHPITFGADDGSPLGRRVALNDSMKSAYRIHDGRVAEVDRKMGQSHFVINVLETTPTPNGKSLPRHFVVNYFDAASGGLQRSEAFSDEYKPVNGVWFPASRRVIFAREGKITSRQIEFRNVKIQLSGEQAAR